MLKLIVTYVAPPIPVRDHDWVAHLEGDDEGPFGWGESSDDATNDWLDNYGSDREMYQVVYS